jgi:hypothetical protein
MSEKLATRVRREARIQANWRGFLDQRRMRLAQQERHGVAAEKVAENILEDLFTRVLDWPLTDLNNQLDHADTELTSIGVKRLLIEVKRPDSLRWYRRAVAAVLEQARGYADEQKVRTIAASDGVMFYAADVVHGGLRDRIYVRLDEESPPEALWWLSVHGIYRPMTDPLGDAARLPDDERPVEEAIDSLTHAPLLHAKYQIPARCFAHVGEASRPTTWKLPYLLGDGSVDLKRLPQAIQAILSHYRGVKVGGVPEKAIPEVLVTLARAAARLGKMPHQSAAPAEVYVQLWAALDQLGRLKEVENPSRF